MSIYTIILTLSIRQSTKKAGCRCDGVTARPAMQVRLPPLRDHRYVQVSQ
jgi:hypothetical protein